MAERAPAPVPRYTFITLGVADMRASIAFYEALGFARKFRATGEVVAFFDTGATAIGLFPWDELAKDATLPANPRPQGFRGVTLAWNCNSSEEVDEVLQFAISKGATLLKAAHKTDYGGYSGYLPTPTVTPGKWWSRRTSELVTIAGCTCRIEASQGAPLIVC
jgi:uncharacterized protein